MSEVVICVCKKLNKSKLSLCLFVGVSAFFDRFGVILGHCFIIRRVPIFILIILHFLAQ